MGVDRVDVNTMFEGYGSTGRAYDEMFDGVQVHVSGIDLVRDDNGEFRVLEDNVRVPSGVSYVMTNRRAISTALPETIAQHRIRPVAAYPQRLLAALRAAAPGG